MIRLHHAALQHFVKNFAILVGIAILFEIADFATAYWDLSSAGKLIPQLIILLMLHQMILFDRTLGTFPKNHEKPPFGHFIWASLITLLAAMAPAIVIAIMIDLPASQTLGVIAIGFLIFYYLVLVLLGTSLPAASVRDSYNPIISIKRAKTTWTSVAGGLLAGPALTGLFVYGAQFLLSRTVGLNVNAYTLGNDISILSAIYGTILQLAGLYLSIVTVVVLCRAYKRVAPSEILTKLEALQGNAS